MNGHSSVGYFYEAGVVALVLTSVHFVGREHVCFFILVLIKCLRICIVGSLLCPSLKSHRILDQAVFLHSDTLSCK